MYNKVYFGSIFGSIVKNDIITFLKIIGWLGGRANLYDFNVLA